MNKAQAMALLRLIADLYQIAEQSDPEPAPESRNGTEPVPVSAS